MQDASILPVLLAGGTGSRLWPLSRSLMPKQFIRLTGDQTMLQQTLQRAAGVNAQAPVVVCNEEHRFIVAEQARQADMALDRIMLEPFGRNTAPAVAMVAMQQRARNADPLLLVLPSDHLIDDDERFTTLIQQGAEAAADGQLVTFGVVPTGPETGFGYIEAGAPLSEGSNALAVSRFVEKPDQATAEQFLAAGNFYWNSGMFMFRASAYLEELRNNRPDIYEACERTVAAMPQDPEFDRVPAEVFEACPDESIDYAVMEHTQKAAVVPFDASWSDLGSWSALWEAEPRDEDDNVCIGDVVTHGTRNSYVRGESRLVAAVGMENAVIVETADAVLVANRDRVQDVKKVVEAIKNGDRTEHHAHARVFRPWGDYQSIDGGHRFQVKRITVKPGEKLSLQMHYHRAEHWVVVKGTAIVECNGEEKLLTENQSTYIPIGATHRLSNPGQVPLELVEVQSGAYVGEDDIVRFEDTYGRS
ncbi:MULTISPECIES: mannose-1-phosphate guanylyltransferase/mannose-6-phosphate isomerase [Halomonadaceae]|uniref:mannose-1-phosphate guanylyltransferase n=1 Tax=Vreelandella halophila TaxID=86177 RepID=A0A9X4Y868_9GAMM|nr:MULTISPECIES: mannose-1-phosphate guanylyltransferase/mannose-6-phosphate isomerase [Halomonas]MYL25264.1 mannose-1-phosphate guanylyltransferase/mannose-6-phosphate isomerase [Halomonas utahensis]MYL75326.1 mannose-1-phosphate guanylyltransferase/mannose-6-phosphate isomerase [Halomonas sp. 22501_18_FS]